MHTLSLQTLLSSVETHRPGSHTCHVVTGNKGLFKQLPHSLALVKDLQRQRDHKAKVGSFLTELAGRSLLLSCASNTLLPLPVVTLCHGQVSKCKQPIDSNCSIYLQNCFQVKHYNSYICWMDMVRVLLDVT